MKIKIIRKIDELGRIVIPKDIRMTLHLEKGDDIEIAVEENAVVLKKCKNAQRAKEVCPLS